MDRVGHVLGDGSSKDNTVRFARRRSHRSLFGPVLTVRFYPTRWDTDYDWVRILHRFDAVLRGMANGDGLGPDHTYIYSECESSFRFPGIPNRRDRSAHLVPSLGVDPATVLSSSASEPL